MATFDRIAAHLASGGGRVERRLTSLANRAALPHISERWTDPAMGLLGMNDGFLRLDAVIAKTGIPRSSLYRMINEGRFPRQVQLSARSVGWRVSAIQRWIEDPTGFRDGG